MPYRSRAQAAKFRAMLARGEIDAATVREFDDSTDFSKLPERVTKKKLKSPAGKSRSRGALKKVKRVGRTGRVSRR